MARRALPTGRLPPRLSKAELSCRTMARSLAGKRLGRFEIVARLGGGSMGDVYRARDTEHDRDVALRVFADELASDPAYRRRALSEGALAKSVRHPAIASLLEVGEDGDDLFMAMELVGGQPLRERLAGGRPSVPEVFAMTTAIASALEVAHAAGVIHRDISPDNVWLSPDGVKVLGFGLAPRTPLVAIHGYMSPEQARGEEAADTSDLFALGAMLYEMLGGTPPFDGNSSSEVAASLRRREPEPLVQHFKRAWPALDRTIAMCLQKDAALRMDSAALLRQRLEEHAEQWRTGPPAATTRPPPPSRNRLMKLLRVAAVLTTFVGLGWGMWLRVQEVTVSVPSASASASASSAPAAIPITALPLPKTNTEALSAYRSGLEALRAARGHAAAQALTKAAAADPSLSAAHWRLAVRHALTPGRVEQAREAYRAAVSHRDKLGPRDGKILDALELLLVRSPPDVRAFLVGIQQASADHPHDAELALLTALSSHMTGDYNGMLHHAQRAVALDPLYGDGWRLVGRALLARGETARGMESYDRCVQVAPTTVDCPTERMNVHAYDGRCDEALAAARLLVKRAPSASAHRHLAAALAATGADDAAIDAALKQANRHDDKRDQPWRRRADQVLLSAHRGDLAGAAKAAGEVVKLLSQRDDVQLRARAVARRVLLLEELGKLAQAGSEAQSFIREQVRWSVPPQLPVADQTPRLLLVQRRAGQLDAGQYAAAVERTLNGWRNSGARDAFSWLFGVAVAADSDAEVRDALRTRPKLVMIDKQLADDAAAGAVGRLYLRGGNIGKGVANLRVVTSSCVALSSPVRHMRAHLRLGQALERQDDSSAACKALQVPAERWGKTRSITAKAAAERMATLSCRTR